MARACVESGPRDQIQYGDITDACNTSHEECTIISEQFTLMMDFAEEMKKMHEEEEILLRRIEQKIKWQTVLRKQRERLNMLRNLAGDTKCEGPPSKKEIDRRRETSRERAAKRRTSVKSAFLVTASEEFRKIVLPTSENDRQ